MTVHSIPLVRAIAVSPFVDFVASLGAPVETMLESAKLSPGILENGNELVPLHQACLFVHKAAVSQGPLIAGARTGLVKLGAFGRIIVGLMLIGSGPGWRV